MANNDKISINQLAKRIGKSWGFGPKEGVEMPANANNEKERSEAQLVYSQMIMGTLASLVWGEKSVKTADKTKSLLSRPNIFELVTSINKNANTIVNSGIHTRLTEKSLSALITKLKTNIFDQLEISIKNDIKLDQKSIDSLINSIQEKINIDKNIKFEINEKTLNNLISRLTPKNIKLDSASIELINKLNESIKNIGTFEDLGQYILGTVYAADEKSKEAELTIIDRLLNASEAYQNNLETYQDTVNSLNTIFNSNDFKESLKNAMENKLTIEFKNPSEDLQNIVNLINELDKFEGKNIKPIINSLNGLINLINVFENSEISSNVSNVKSNIKTISELFNEDLTKVFNNIDIFKQILDKLETSIKFDSKLINENISEIIKVIGKPGDEIGNNTAASIQSLFIRISDILKDDKIKEISKDITALNSVLHTIITVISLDTSKINLKGLRILLSISDPKTGLIAKLLKHLRDLTKGENGATIDNKNFISINKFFEAMSSIGDIGYMKRHRIKSNIKYFIGFIGKDIPILLDEIKKSSQKEIDNETVKSIAALGSIFESLLKIGELKNKDKRRLRKNISYIKNFIIDDVIDILKKIIDELNKITPEANKAIEQLNNLFDKFTEIGNKSIFKLIKLGINLEIIESILRSQLIGDAKDNTGILYTITNIDIKILNKALNRLEKINTIFDSLLNIVDNDRLSLKNTLSLTIKLHILNYLFENPLNNILLLISKLDGRTLNGIISKLEKLDRVFEGIGDVIDNINDLHINIFKAILLWGSLKIHIANVRLIKEIIKELNQIKPGKNIEKTLNAIKLLSELKVSIKRANRLNKIFESLNESTGYITDIIKVLNQIKPDKNIDKTLNIIKLLAEIKVDIISAFLLKRMLKQIYDSTEIIKNICENISEIDPNQIKQAQETIGAFNNIVAKAAAVLLIGGLVMRIIKPIDLIIFAVTLAGFLWGVTKVYKLMSESIQDNIEISKNAIELIAISGAILILGGLTMNFINPVKLMLFALTLGTFMMIISLVYSTFNSVKEDVFASAKDFAILIAISAGVLILGALFMLKPILGLAALGFGILLAGFVWLITKVYTLASKELKASLHSAKGLAILVGISALTLMIGALFVSNGKRALAALTFGLILGVFISLIMLAIRIGGKNIKSSLSTMIAISTLVAIAAATLLLGGALFMIFPDLVGNVILFGLILLGFITLIGLICLGLNALKRYIKPGIIILGGIIIIIGMAAIALGLVAITAWLISKVGWGNVIGTLATMVITFGILLVLCRIIGDPSVVLWVALGVIVLAALTVVLYLMIGTIAVLIAVTKYASTLKREQVQTAFDNISATVWGMVKLTPAFLALAAASVLMAPGFVAAIGLSIGLAGLAKTVQTWANLRIPEYDSKGKVIGYKQMNSTDFTNASENIKIVLTTLFRAIKTVYDENSDIFTLDWNSVLDGKNPIQRVISSSMKMGNMLSNIAKGVKAWTKLTIPEYEYNGKSVKIIGYKTIDKNDFRNAAENIKSVIVCLGQAVLDVYKEAPPGMFVSTEWFGLGNTPFAKVTKALKTMGPMLSSIAKAIKLWVKLQIPIYEGTKVIGYHQLGSDEFTNAKDNIVKVVRTLADGVLEVYKVAPAGMFDDDSWHGFGSTPFARVTKSLKTMGTALGNIADAVKDWAELRIPVYGDKNDATKITDYKTINDDDFKNVSKNIAYVVTALATSIAELAKDPKYGELFTNENWFTGKSDVAKVLRSIQPLGSSLKDIAEAIVAWSSMNVPEYNDKENPTKITGYIPITETMKKDTVNNIKEIILTLFRGVGEIYYSKENGYELKKIFDNEGHWYTLGIGVGKSPLEKVLGAVVPLGEALKNIADAVKGWSELRIPIYGKNSLEPIGYMSIGGETGINTAMSNITKVMRAILSSVVSVYYGKLVIKTKSGNKEYYYKDLLKDDNEIINNMSSAMSKLGNLVGNVAKGIKSIAELRIPVYNKDGKVIAYHNIENGDFTKISGVISSVLTAIGKALINVASDPLLNPKDNPAFGTAVEAIKYSTDILGSIANVVANYATGKFVVYKVEKNKLVPEKVIDINNADIQSNIQKNIITVLTTIGDALALLVGVGQNNKLKYATPHNTEQMEIVKTAIIKLTDSIAEIYKSIGKLNEAATSNKDAINKLISPETEDASISNILVKSITALNDIASNVNNNVLTSNLEYVFNNAETLEKYITSTHKVLNTILVKLSALANANVKVKNAGFQYISSTIEKFTTELSNVNRKLIEARKANIDLRKLSELITYSDKLTTLLENFAKIIKSCKDIEGDEYKKIENSILGLSLAILNVDDKNNLKFSAFTELITNYVNLINSIPTLFDSRVNSLKDGILNIDKITKEVNSKNNFNKHTKDLEKYIQTINKIELSKLSQLKGFVDALNRLSNQFGNLDQLTDAIANKLTIVLFELVNQLRMADASIQNAHELQNKRKKLIDESVKTIENIMNKHMIVEISQTTDTGNQQPKPTGSGGEGGSSSKGGGNTGDDNTWTGGGQGGGVRGGTEDKSSAPETESNSTSTTSSSGGSSSPYVINNNNVKKHEATGTDTNTKSKEPKLDSPDNVPPMMAPQSNPNSINNFSWPTNNNNNNNNNQKQFGFAALTEEQFKSLMETTYVREIAKAIKNYDLS